MSVRVAIFNDSPSVLASLSLALGHAPDFEVVATEQDASDAVNVVRRARPDVIVMDVVMPAKDGYTATRDIMAAAPTPIVMMSHVVDPKDAKVVFDAMAAGAVYITGAPPPPNHQDYAAECASLAQLLRGMAQAHVSRKRAETQRIERAPSPNLEHVAVIGIVASAGGPGALLDLLTALPPDKLPPIAVVQHMAAGFVDSFCQWIQERTGHRTVVARDAGETMQAGTVYVAPDDRHLRVGADLQIELGADPHIERFRPSATALLSSMAQHKERGLAVILTGMGADGAEGALAMRRAGGRVAAQDEATSVVYGMPQAALEAGGVQKVLPLENIAGWILAEVARC